MKLFLKIINKNDMKKAHESEKQSALFEKGDCCRAASLAYNDGVVAILYRNAGSKKASVGFPFIPKSNYQ
jgi:hypothetical protein